MARRIPTLLTSYDVQRICLNSAPQSLEDCYISKKSYNRFNLSQFGNAFDLEFQDGQKLHYRFGRDYLEWSTDGTNFHEEKAAASVVDDKYIYIHHMFTDKLPYTASTMVIDPSKGYAVCIDMCFGNKYSDRDVNRTVRYAGLNRPCPVEDLLTDELTGAVIDWKYEENCRVHSMYENRSCSEFVSDIPAKMPEWEDFYYTFNPTKYVKLDEKVYLISFYAPGMSGVCVNQLMNLHTMKCIGSFWGIDFTDKLRSYMFDGYGACADVAFIGRYTVD